MEHHLPKFPKKITTLRGIPKFQKTFPGIFFSISRLSSRNSRNFGWIFPFRKFNSFRNFWKIFQENSVPSATVSKLSKVLDKWKAPLRCPWVVYHLQKAAWKAGKWNTWLFESFQWKISVSNETSEKGVLFFRTDSSKRKFVFRFFKDIFDTSFSPSRPFFGSCNWLVEMVNATKFTSL